MFLFGALVRLIAAADVNADGDVSPPNVTALLSLLRQ